MEAFSLDEMKKMAKAIFSKALSAVDPSKILKERIRIEGDRLSIKMEGDSEKVFDLKAFHDISSRYREGL